MMQLLSLRLFISRSGSIYQHLSKEAIKEGYFKGVEEMRPWGDSLVRDQLKEDLKRGAIAHAYLMAGRSSEKKKEIVMWFVQGLLCLKPEGGYPCNACLSCQAWLQELHPDYHYLQPEGSSLKMDQLRLWNSFFRNRPNLGRHQVFLLEKPELLTAPAANSLLKILEEPLPGTVFLLSTEDERSLLPTIVSRCRVVYFRGGGEKLGLGEENRKADRFFKIMKYGTPADLLKEVRFFGTDRGAARHLLQAVLALLEREYRLERKASLAACLSLLLEGMRQLEENVSVPLVLSLSLYRAQKELQCGSTTVLESRDENG